MNLLNIGFGNLVSEDRIVAMLHPDSAPVKRVIRQAGERGALIDASFGRRTKSVIITDSDHVILSSLQLERIAERYPVTMTEGIDEAD
ncbi:MAG: DUF370 domain-containing protein [Oscillospiraceae bacterium]|nr:DUF370 domain-containing protein [Oscillospiraceae bacterium]